MQDFEVGVDLFLTHNDTHCPLWLNAALLEDPLLVFNVLAHVPWLVKLTYWGV